jgi:hypothetical protein
VIKDKFLQWVHQLVSGRTDASLAKDTLAVLFNQLETFLDVRTLTVSGWDLMYSLFLRVNDERGAVRAVEPFCVFQKACVGEDLVWKVLFDCEDARVALRATILLRDLGLSIQENGDDGRAAQVHRCMEKLAALAQGPQRQPGWESQILRCFHMLNILVDTVAPHDEQRATANGPRPLRPSTDGGFFFSCECPANALPAARSR